MFLLVPSILLLLAVCRTDAAAVDTDPSLIEYPVLREDEILPLSNSELKPTLVKITPNISHDWTEGTQTEFDESDRNITALQNIHEINMTSLFGYGGFPCYFCPPTFCPFNTITVDGGCFRFVNIKMTWRNAKRDCEMQGGFLAIPKLHYRYFTQQLAQVYRDILGKKNVWIGGYDDSRIQWRWVDNSPLSVYHPNWYPGHPGNYVANDCTSIHVMRRGRLQIYKYNCFYESEFLCQFPIRFTRQDKEEVTEE